MALCATWFARGLLLYAYRAVRSSCLRSNARYGIDYGAQKPEPVIPDNRPVRGPLASITPLEFIQVRRTPEEALFNSLDGAVSLSGYEQPIGESI